MAGKEFACHRSGTEQLTTCVGYLLRGARHNLATRIRSMTGKIDWKSISGDSLELFASYRRMAEVNSVAADDPVLDRCRD